MKKDYSSRIFSLGQWKVVEDLMPTDLLEEYQQAFQILDRKNIGKISIRDLSTVTCSIGVQLTADELRIYVDDVITCLRHNGDMSSCDPIIDFSSFLKLMAIILTEWISVEEVMTIFGEFDSDGDGFISPEELRSILDRHQTKLTDEQLEDMMTEADRDGDGMVCLREFVSVMSTSKVMADRLLNNMDQNNGKKGKGCSSGKQNIEERRKSLVNWIRQNSFKLEAAPTGNKNRNSNKDHDKGGKAKKSSLSEKFTATLNSLRNQVFENDDQGKREQLIKFFLICFCF